MTQQEIRMMETLEMAREVSEYNNYPVYAFGNGEKIRFVIKQDDNLVRPFEEIRADLESKGYWLVSIFENGHRVEA